MGTEPAANANAKAQPNVIYNVTGVPIAEVASSAPEAAPQSSPESATPASIPESATPASTPDITDSKSTSSAAVTSVVVAVLGMVLLVVQ